jgi:hypothetical protein
MFALAVHVNGKREELARREQINLLLQEQRIRTKVDIFLARHQAFDNFFNLRMQERFAAGNGDGGRAALIHCPEALFRRELHFEYVRWILNLATAGAGQIAAKEWLQHQHKRILLASLELLLDDVTCDRPGLRYGYRHSVDLRSCEHSVFSSQHSATEVRQVKTSWLIAECRTLCISSPLPA